MGNGYLIVIQVREVGLRQFKPTLIQRSFNRFLSDHVRDVFRRGETDYLLPVPP